MSIYSLSDIEQELNEIDHRKNVWDEDPCSKKTFTQDQVQTIQRLISRAEFPVFSLKCVKTQGKTKTDGSLVSIYMYSETTDCETVANG